MTQQKNEHNQLLCTKCQAVMKNWKHEDNIDDDWFCLCRTCNQGTELYINYGPINDPRPTDKKKV